MKFFDDVLEGKLGTLLTQVFERAEAKHRGETALYLVDLLEERGLALAQAVHKLSPDRPDPAELRRRAAAMGAVGPLLVGAVRMDALARALASLESPEPPDGHLLAWTAGELHRQGGVPVVLLTEGMALVATLDALTPREDDDLELWGWGWPPPVGEA